MTPVMMSDILETIAWGEKMFGSLTTNRHCTKRDVAKAVRAGFARSIGQVALCDDDCHIIEPERYREGFVLTDAGKAELKRNPATWSER